LKTPRCTLTDGICPSNTSVQVKRLWTRCPLRPTRGVSTCSWDSKMCHAKWLPWSSESWTHHRGSPYHPPSKTGISMVHLRSERSRRQHPKLANVNNINTKRVGSISDIGKWVFERYLGSRYTIPEKSFCLILRRYSYFLDKIEQCCKFYHPDIRITVISWINEFFFVIEAACVGDWFHCLIPVLIPVAPES
jgi:hypothetical protein